jgi:hypothetical protein
LPLTLLQGLQLLPRALHLAAQQVPVLLPAVQCRCCSGCQLLVGALGTHVGCGRHAPELGQLGDAPGVHGRKTPSMPQHKAGMCTSCFKSAVSWSASANCCDFWAACAVRATTSALAASSCCRLWALELMPWVCTVECVCAWALLGCSQRACSNHPVVVKPLQKSVPSGEAAVELGKQQPWPDFVRWYVLNVLRCAWQIITW